MKLPFRVNHLGIWIDNILIQPSAYIFLYPEIKEYKSYFYITHTANDPKYSISLTFFTSWALVDRPLHESPRQRNQNSNSEFFSVDGFLPASELPEISSSVSKRGPYKVFAIFSLPDRKGTLLNDTFVENFLVETVKFLRFGSYDLVFVPLAPAFTGWRPFWNKV